MSATVELQDWLDMADGEARGAWRFMRSGMNAEVRQEQIELRTYWAQVCAGVCLGEFDE